jgi:hypothetical protein
VCKKLGQTLFFSQFSIFFYLWNINTQSCVITSINILNDAHYIRYTSLWNLYKKCIPYLSGISTRNLNWHELRCSIRVCSLNFTNTTSRAKELGAIALSGIFSKLCSHKKKKVTMVSKHTIVQISLYLWLNGQYMLPYYSKKSFFFLNLMPKRTWQKDKYLMPDKKLRIPRKLKTDAQTTKNLNWHELRCSIRVCSLNFTNTVPLQGRKSWGQLPS